MYFFVTVPLQLCFGKFWMNLLFIQINDLKPTFLLGIMYSLF